MKRGRYSGSSSDIVGDWSWTGDATADWSDGDKTIDMGVNTLTVNGLLDVTENITGLRFISDTAENGLAFIFKNNESGFAYGIASGIDTVSVKVDGTFIQEWSKDGGDNLLSTTHSDLDVTGNIDATAYKVGGAAGVSGSGTNVTAVNGIVTAIS